jgi:hypothetical protein
MPLTPEAKKLLGETIRRLRGRLLADLHDEADRRYRLSVPVEKAGLDEAHRRRRERIEAWLDERARASKPKNAAELKSAKARLLGQAEKEAAATLLNRIVLLRALEALGLSKPAVVTGGWNSSGYREFRGFAPALSMNGTTNETEGYSTLLQLLFDELSIDLPGLFGDVGLTRLFPVPAATLRDVVESLDDSRLESAWMDDTTLGWVYQYWNDPDREALDAKIAAGGKIQPHEIASKTQMFTERYMVEWLLQNSLGLTWLCMCRKHGWTPDAERVLPVLEARRVEWRRKRDAGEVALDALMPIEGALEDRWKYFVLQPLPDDAVEKAPESVKTLKILDPACGSGHFLVIAFDLLAALYREEARHRGEEIGDREIAESILENNLHGIDIDPRAIQIAAAALYLKGRSFARDARPKTLNLVAPVLQLGNLSANDPAVVQLREDLRREAGIPAELTKKLLEALEGVDYLGSLLKVDAAVGEAIRAQDEALKSASQKSFVYASDDPNEEEIVDGTGADELIFTDPKATVLGKLEEFLARHSTSGDLGLRLDGEQLAAGVRFVRMAKEGSYDVVVGNPPYQGLAKTQSFGYVAMTYPRGKADLYAAFLERGLELAKAGGTSALLTMRGWMFVGQFAEMRDLVLRCHDLRGIGDFDRGAFDEVPNELLAVAVTVIRRDAASNVPGVAVLPTPMSDKSYDRDRTTRKRAAVLAHVGRHEFDPRAFSVIDREPIVYWWDNELLNRYRKFPTLGRVHPVRKGVCTCDDMRYTRKVWEVAPLSVLAMRDVDSGWKERREPWLPTIMGGEGLEWFEPLQDVVLWRSLGLEMKVDIERAYRVVSKRIQSESFYMKRGVAFAMIGNHFAARVHRFRSIFGNMGSSVFPDNTNKVVCALNQTVSRLTLASLNPGLHFEVGDVNRLPLSTVPCSDVIMSFLEQCFSEHEASRECSVEFRCPGGTRWSGAQKWAQRAVDRHADEALPPFQPPLEPASPADTLSFAFGVALGRFGANGEGALSSAPPDSVPGGTLFLSTEAADSLDHPACAPIHAAWGEHGAAISPGDDLRTYLRKSFFDYHRKLYENRPIYFALSSAKKSFVAFVSIHRWQDDTLNVLLADHLVPTRRRLEGELDDLRIVRASATAKGKGNAEKRFADVQKLLEELNDFIAKVTEIAEKGPPPDATTPPREVDARYTMDLNDGVMVNSSALWPLLEPQWKGPKKWWKDMATAQDEKDYDWSHLAARYYPDRARKKCVTDPSLAVAHCCFWELHPAKAYAWELRLQHEIRPDFTIDEPGSDAARARFLAEHASGAADLRAAEQKRRARKAAKADQDDAPLLDVDEESEAEDGADA